MEDERVLSHEDPLSSPSEAPSIGGGPDLDTDAFEQATSRPDANVLDGSKGDVNQDEVRWKDAEEEPATKMISSEEGFEATPTEEGDGNASARVKLSPEVSELGIRNIDSLDLKDTRCERKMIRTRKRECRF